MYCLVFLVICLSNGVFANFKQINLKMVSIELGRFFIYSRTTGLLIQRGSTSAFAAFMRLFTTMGNLSELNYSYVLMKLLKMKLGDIYYNYFREYNICRLHDLASIPWRNIYFLDTQLIF